MGIDWFGDEGPDSLHRPSLRRLLGKALSRQSLAALSTTYDSQPDQVAGWQYYLPKYLRHVLKQRAAAVARGLDTSYIDSFASELLQLGILWPCTKAQVQKENTIAWILMRSSYQEAIIWLLERLPYVTQIRRFWRMLVCSELANHGQFSLLEQLPSFLNIPEEPTEENKTFQQMVCRGNATSIPWLCQTYPAHVSPELCQQAAELKNLEQLQILRGLQPPCPWDASTSESALEWRTDGVPMLRWILHQDDPCPVDLSDARLYPCIIAASGHVQLMQQIWPVRARPQQLFRTAAAHGQLDMLKWLSAQQSQEGPGEQAAYLAARHNHLDVVNFLLESGPPFPFPTRLQDVPMRCLVSVAKAGCRLCASDKARVAEMLSPWMLSHCWAVEMGSPAAVS